MPCGCTWQKHSICGCAAHANTYIQLFWLRSLSPITGPYRWRFRILSKCCAYRRWLTFLVSSSLTLTEAERPQKVCIGTFPAIGWSCALQSSVSVWLSELLSLITNTESKTELPLPRSKSSSQGCLSYSQPISQVRTYLRVLSPFNLVSCQSAFNCQQFFFPH